MEISSDMILRVLVTTLSLSLLLVGCASSTETDANAADPEGCDFTADGVCDEPANCALGTDEADCVEACQAGTTPHLIAAACDFRDIGDPAPVVRREGAVPSGGTSRLVGWLDRTTAVPSGVDLSRNVDRFYRIHVPENYDPQRPYPLVINMAGHRVGHRVLPNNTQLPRTAELNDFIVVYAAQEFRENRWAWWTDWDWENEADANPDFVFLRTIVDEVSADYNIDRARVFTSGHSRGAAMAFIAAFELDDIIAGAVAQSGFTEFGYLDSRLTEHDGRKVPIVLIHGVADDDVCIDCEPGAVCGVMPSRQCAPGMHASDAIFQRLLSLGWAKDGELRYYRLDNVAHRWQSQLNQQWFDFLSARPHPQPATGGQQ